MSSVFQKLKKDNISQRKAKDPKSGETGFIISKINANAKSATKDGVTPEITDAMCYSELRSYIKQVNQTIDSAGDKLSEEDKARLLSNIEMAKSYLPNEIDDEVIRADVIAILDELDDTSPKVTGKIMKELGAKYGGAFNGQKVIAIVKEVLSS